MLLVCRDGWGGGEFEWWLVPEFRGAVWFLWKIFPGGRRWWYIRDGVTKEWWFSGPVVEQNHSISNSPVP